MKGFSSGSMLDSKLYSSKNKNKQFYSKSLRTLILFLDVYQYIITNNNPDLRIDLVFNFLSSCYCNMHEKQ
jgi:hypothetical protein